MDLANNDLVKEVENLRTEIIALKSRNRDIEEILDRLNTAESERETLKERVKHLELEAAKMEPDDDSKNDVEILESETERRSDEDHSKCVGVCTCKRPDDTSSDEELLKCDQCGFQSRSQMGLKIHIGKKHPGKKKKKGGS